MGKVKDFFGDVYDSVSMPWWQNMMIQMGMCLLGAVATAVVLRAIGFW